MRKENQLKSCYKIMLSSPNTHHSSSRCLPHGQMRDIVAGVPNASLYSVQLPYGMTSEARAGFPAPRHSGRFLSGIWARTSAFTLIELLIVVLIIGILAAVALPQYQRAVEKSRATQAFTIVKSLAEAQERYFLANGEYATSFDSFDIEIPGEDTSYNGYARRKTDDFDFGLNSAYSNRTIIALAQRWEKGQVHVGGKGLYAFIKVANDPNIYCTNRQDNPYGICKTLSGGRLSPIYSGWYIIRL